MQLPPAPQIELIVDKPHLSAVVRRPLVRIRRKCAWLAYFSKTLSIPNPQSRIEGKTQSFYKNYRSLITFHAYATPH